ncbi:MAG: hypothetical protein KDC83_05005 [Flavobacteriales bacterium]|nr:hypothetical protein [Flavobacteriales bacterium]
MQLFFWLGACYLAFLTSRIILGGLVWPSVSFLLIATYLSAIILTSHVLTEILTLFLLSLLVFVFSSYFEKDKNLAFGVMVLALVSVLISTSITLWVGDRLVVPAIGI